MSPAERAAAFLRAGECYQRAGLPGDALRCFLDGGAPAVAARLIEPNAPAQAASLYEAAGDLRSAARAWLAAGEPEAGARCLVAAGEHAEAAWLYAHTLGRGKQALALLERVEGTDDGPAGWLVRLTRDRALGRLRTARDLCRHLGDLPAGPPRELLLQRAIDASMALARLDLAVQLHAAAGPAGQEAWEKWAITNLGVPCTILDDLQPSPRMEVP